MKLNKLFTASLLAALAMGAYACGGDDDDSCTNGEYKACSDSTHAVVCQNNKWVTIDCGKSSKVCSNDTHKCVEQGGGGNGGGGNGGDASSAVNTFCESVASCSSESGAKEECLETFKELSGSKKCASQVNALFECAAKISDCQAKVMAVMGMDDTCATQLAAVESCDEGGNGGNVGDPCDRSTYKQSCINNGANALVCWDDVVTQWTCANTCQDAGYDSSKPLQVKCDKGNGGNTGTCTDDDYVGTCADDHKTAVVCVKGEVKNYTCFSDICETRTDGTIYCPKDQKAVDNEAIRRECEEGGKTIYTSGGSAGDCCDAENYVPDGCVEATNSGLRCSSGVIVEWTCTSPKVCHFDPESTEYVGGKYSCVNPS